MNCSAAHMKYAYMKRSVRQHLYRKPTKSSKYIHKVALLVLTNAAIMSFNAMTISHMPAATTWEFVNTSHAEVAGDNQPDQTTTETGDHREDDSNPTMVKTDHDSIAEEIKRAFPEDHITAQAVAFAESWFNPAKDSELDLMHDNRPFSVGLFQINLTWHEVAGVKCYEAFDGKNYDAIVTDEDLYAKCIALAKDPKINIATARSIYDRSDGSFGRWTTYVTGAYKRYTSQFN